jgi:IclR family pca regulon transcriptional regulator
MNDTVRSAARVLSLVELLSNETTALTLSGVAERLDTPKSSTLMLLRTLVTRGYARRTESDRYEISPDFRSGAFGWRAGVSARLTAVARPVLEALTRELGESTTLGVIAEAGEARLLLKHVADVEIRWDSDLGRLIPLYCTAVGRALLFDLPPREQLRHLQAIARPQITPQTVTDLTELSAILGQARQDRYVIVREEFALGGTGLATPLHGVDGAVVGALNVACVTSRYASKHSAMVQALLRGRALIEAGLQTTVSAGEPALNHD